MFKMLGTAVAAVTMGWAGSAGAATYLGWGVIEDHLSSDYRVLELSAGGTITLVTDAPVQDFYLGAWISGDWGWHGMDGRTLAGGPFDGWSYTSVGLAEPTVQQVGNRITFSWGDPPPSTYEENPACFDYGGETICGSYEHWDYDANIFFTVNFKPEALGMRYEYWDGAYIPSAIPEPQTWALMIAGFGIVGTALRRRGLSLAA